MDYLIGSEGEFVYVAGETGLVGTLEYRVDDNQGATVIAATTTDIIELGTTGTYSVTITLPGTEGDWTILWSVDGSFDENTDAESFRTVATVTEAPSIPPLSPIAEDGAGLSGPCLAWTSADAMFDADCCTVDGTDPDVLEDAIVAASQLLYPLSGNAYPGTCSRTVRPCADSFACEGPWGMWAGTYWGFPSRGSRLLRRGCGCAPLSRVPLAGHARGITEVTIDGEVVDADTYRLDEHLWLTRVRHPDDLDTPLYWPSCQAMDKPLTADGTFGITYDYGFDPPSSGILAAQELACAIYSNCPGVGEIGDGTCNLPSNITHIERQGISIDLAGFSQWGLVNGSWQTGMPMVDAFLNAVNPTGTRRKVRAQVWSPDLWRYPRPVAASGS